MRVTEGALLIPQLFQLLSLFLLWFLAHGLVGMGCWSASLGGGAFSFRFVGKAKTTGGGRLSPYYRP